MSDSDADDLLAQAAALELTEDEPDPGAVEPTDSRAVRPTLEASGAAAAAMAGSVLDDGDGASASAPGTDTWAHEPGEHPIQNTYAFHYMRRTAASRAENYEKSIKKISSFNTVEQMWRVYNHMVRPNDLPNTTDYHLFKED